MVILSGAVFAAPNVPLPGMPHRFFGDVTSNGNSVPNGIAVTAKVDGVQVSGVTTLNSVYGGEHNSEIFYVQDPLQDRSGKTIEFFVSGIKVGEAAFASGASTQLDFEVPGLTFCGDGTCSSSESCSSCVSDCGTCSSSSGSSGSSGSGGGSKSSGSSSGSYVPAAAKEEVIVECTPEWECSDWYECINGYQKRTCTDKNLCEGINETETGKPEEGRQCAIPDEQKPANVLENEIAEEKAERSAAFKERIGNAITGFVTSENGGVSPVIVGTFGFMLLAVVALAIFVVIKNRTSEYD